MPRYLALGGVLVAALVLSLLALHPAPATGDAATGTINDKAMRVGLDPETGKLVHLPPDPSQRAMDLSRSGEGLTQVFHPDGTVSINLEGRFQCYVQAQIGPDGKVSYGCDHKDHAVTSTNTASAAPTY